MNNITDLAQKIQDSKDGNKESIMEIITKFKPLINKYRWKLGYEDAENELIEHLIITLKKMPIKDEGRNVGYITTSIKNKYLQLSKKKSKYEEEIIDSEIVDQCFTESIYDSLSDELMKLDERYRKVIVYRYYYGYSDQQIGEILHLTRQSVCRIRNKALKSLRKNIES